jgi:hypothetical protein
MKKLIATGLAGITWAILAGGVAEAQQPAGPTGAGSPPPSTEFGTRAPAPPPPPRPELGLEPTSPPEEVYAREQDLYPGVLVRSRHEPAFVRPFVTNVNTSPTSTARVGLSGWTAPALPYDAPDSGGLAFGLTIQWGITKPETKAPEGEPASQK